MPATRGVKKNHSHKEPGDRPRPPDRQRAAADKVIPTRSGSIDIRKRKPPSLRRPVPSSTPVTPYIRAVKKAVCDSDSEESSISSVSWQGPKKPCSFNRSQFPSKREAPKPTEITVDMDDASSVSSGGDSSWESFRELPSKLKSGNMQRQRQQKEEPKPVTHDTEIIGFDSVAGFEVLVQNVYSSDEESECSQEFDFEPEDLFH